MHTHTLMKAIAVSDVCLLRSLLMHNRTVRVTFVRFMIFWKSASVINQRWWSLKQQEPSQTWRTSQPEKSLQPSPFCNCSSVPASQFTNSRPFGFWTKLQWRIHWPLPIATSTWRISLMIPIVALPHWPLLFSSRLAAKAVSIDSSNRSRPSTPGIECFLDWVVHVGHCWWF